MHANLTVTLRHETGRETTINNARAVYQDRDAQDIVVEFLMPSVDTDLHTEEYGLLEWEIESVSHTETPIDE